MKHYRMLTFVLVGLFCMAGVTSIVLGSTRLLRDSVLRESPSFLGKALGTVRSGASIAVLGDDGSWRKVKVGKQQGWLPGNAFEAPAKLVSGSAPAKVNASSGSAALAGKGFDLEAETEARKRAPQNFHAVDIMQSYAVSEADKAAFLRAGSEGGGR